MWRDKGLELIIQAFQRKLKSVPPGHPIPSYEEYLAVFDSDHDKHLTPGQFRAALLSFKEVQLTRQQIDRVLHILLEEKKAQPLISIDRFAEFLRGYKSIDEENGKAQSALLIDEDLFVYIVERYDGFSRLLEQFNAVEERATYISRHTHEIGDRSLNLLSN